MTPKNKRLNKKFYAHYKKTRCKDEIIVYAKDKKEAEKLVDDYSSKIDWDYGNEEATIFNWPPKEKFDKDNTLIIRRNKITEPKFKSILTFSGELFKDLWPEERESELAPIQEDDFKRLRKRIVKVIREQIRKSRIKNFLMNLK